LCGIERFQKITPFYYFQLVFRGYNTHLLMWNATAAPMHKKAKLRVASNIIIDEDTVCSDIGNIGCRQTKNDVARVG
jgi:hypothetical protein